MDSIRQLRLKKIICSAVVGIAALACGQDCGCAAPQAISADVSAIAGNVAHANVDASLYLDYAAGMKAGVYRWLKSEDGTYYTLVFTDEKGQPVPGRE